MALRVPIQKTTQDVNNLTRKPISKLVATRRPPLWNIDNQAAGAPPQVGGPAKGGPIISKKTNNEPDKKVILASTKQLPKPCVLDTKQKGPVAAGRENATMKLPVIKEAAAGPKSKPAVLPAKKEGISSKDATSQQQQQATSYSSQALNVPDIDAEDHDNPQLVSLYVNDIYDYLRELEVRCKIRPKFLRGQITGRMRGILMDWLVQVSHRFGLLAETYYMTVTIIDRFLQEREVEKRNLQLIGITALFIASKYEEMYCPSIDDYANITDKAFTPLEMRRTEVTMLKVLKFNFSRPLPLHFLRRNSKAGEVDVQTHMLAKYLMELSTIDYDMAHYAPSHVAAAALCLALKLLGNHPWTDTLVFYSKYNEQELTPVMNRLAFLVVKSETHRLQAVRQKYSSMKFLKISSLHELKGEKIKRMAMLAAV